ncbi:hypothetical protein [Nannocystis pusilla]|uniref:hypothetical protein n=1 Tax=Nannocystis pusilla TaxID=889268 RepID=UPI003B78EC0C
MNLALARRRLGDDEGLARGCVAAGIAARTLGARSSRWTSRRPCSRRRRRSIRTRCSLACEAAPVHRLERYEWWAVTRYADVAKILRRPDLFSSDTGLDRLRPPHIDERTWRELDRMRGPSMFNSDPPEHTRLRKLVSAAFTPRAMTQLEERVQQIASRLIEAILQHETFDVVEDLAIPLPVTVIAEMLGVDPARGADFKRWSDDLIALSRLARERRGSANESVRLMASRREFYAHMQAMIAARRESPRDDLISQLVRAESEEGRSPPRRCWGWCCCCWWRATRRRPT